jgi:hypothetical protein
MPSVHVAAVDAPWGPVHLAAGDRGVVACESMTPYEPFVERLERRFRSDVSATRHSVLDEAVRLGDAVGFASFHARALVNRGRARQGTGRFEEAMADFTASSRVFLSSSFAGDDSAGAACLSALASGAGSLPGDDSGAGVSFSSSVATVCVSMRRTRRTVHRLTAD